MSSLAEVIQEREQFKHFNKLHYYEPYPFQKCFHLARDGETYEASQYGHHRTDLAVAIQRALISANQVGKCVTKDTLIEHPDGTRTKAGVLYERGKPFQVMSWDGEKLVEATAVHPIKKPAEECFRVFLSDGSFFEAAPEHRILTTDGWVFLGDTLPQIPRLSSLESALLVRALGVQRLFGTLAGCLGRCFAGLRQYGVRLQISKENAQVSSPSQGDALQHNAVLCNVGDLGNRYTSNSQRAFDHPSNLGVCRRALALFSESICRTFGSISAQCRESIQAFYPQYAAVASGFQSNRGVDFQECSSVSLVSPSNKANRIIAYSSVGVQEVYDFTVPEYGNYYTCGAIHHNTYCAAMETAMHLTGIYPEWWDGIRFKSPVRWLVVGKTNDTTRDVCQKELFGDPKIPSELGSGAVPKDQIVETKRKPGVPDAFMSVTVKHITGGTSTVQFMASEQGPDAFMGRTYDGAWADEEPHKDVWSQILRCFFSRTFYTILLTFTPEMGMTQVVDGFLNNLQKGQAVVRATWDDAKHMTEERKETFLSQLMPHERDMRARGIPLMGSGLVWPISEDDIVIDPIPIPSYWRRINGLDFGIDHPFGAAFIAHDSENDVVHIYADYSQRGTTPPVHASAIKQRGAWIPCVWPHDGLAKDKGSGIPLADIYRKENLNMLPEKFSNPPAPGQKEGQGGFGTEVGIIEMWNRMETGRLKVHSTCTNWLSEFRQYHRKDGQIVKLKDDCISASRYAIMSLRHAYTQPVRRVQQTIQRGARNW